MLDEDLTLLFQRKVVIPIFMKRLFKSRNDRDTLLHSTVKKILALTLHTSCKAPSNNIFSRFNFTAVISIYCNCNLACTHAKFCQLFSRNCPSGATDRNTNGHG